MVVAAAMLIPLIWTRAQLADEKEAVRQAILDYVEGVYSVDPARIERSERQMRQNTAGESG
jgi:hypothetical protein